MEKNKYTYFASLLDKTKQDTKKTFSSEEEKKVFQKINFIWKNCSSGKADQTEIWHKTMHKINAHSNQSIRRKKYISIAKMVSVAALLIFILSIGYIYQYNQKSDIKEFANLMNTLPATQAETNEVTLIISGEKQIPLAENAKVSYSSEGSVSVNTQKIDIAETEKEEYNQIIVPKGKRSQIILADGSKVWINSGTKVIYPRRFTGKTREIFIDGQVYLDVIPNKDKPFIVNTSGFEVKVLGTSFCVSTYKQLINAEVVLVEGCVEVKDENNTKINIIPDQLVSIGKQGIIGKENINAKVYTSWVDGILIMQGEKLETLLPKLELYYGVTISYDAVIKDELIYGKLDLQDSFIDVLNSIITAIPVQYTQKNENTYHINVK